MGNVYNICKDDKRADVKGEYLSTKSPDNAIEDHSPEKGKSGIDQAIKEKELNYSNTNDYSGYDKNNEFSIVNPQKGPDDSKNESVIINNNFQRASNSISKKLILTKFFR